MQIHSEGNVLFNDALNTFHLRLYGVRHMVKDHYDCERETHFRHMRYSFRLAARVLLYAPYLRQDNTYHDLCYTRNSSMGPPCRIDPTTYRTMDERIYHGATSRSRSIHFRVCLCFCPIGLKHAVCNMHLEIPQPASTTTTKTTTITTTTTKIINNKNLQT